MSIIYPCLQAVLHGFENLETSAHWPINIIKFGCLKHLVLQSFSIIKKIKCNKYAVPQKKFLQFIKEF